MKQGRIRFFIIAIVWFATLSAVFLWFISGQKTRLAIAAGSSSSESFELAWAIADEFNKQSSNIIIDVYETSGSGENIALLNKGQVDFATIQSDTRVSKRIKAVASLYTDAYQLVVNSASDIMRFNDLTGMRVAIAPLSSGESESFWFLARHFGLDKDRLTALPMSEEAADFAMSMGQVDAIFRVRAAGNEGIRKLVQDRLMRLVPIYQAEALSLKMPAISAGIIPLGSYRGAPPLPASDLPTAVLKRILVTRAGLDSELVRKVTRSLFEMHSQLIARTALAGFIEPIDPYGRISIPLHPGAQGYYDREKPSFLQQNTRLIASLLYVTAILISGGLALRSHLLRKQRIRIGTYNSKLVKIMNQARHADSVELLDGLKEQLLAILQELLVEIDKERVTQDEFGHFSFTWQAADTVIRERITLLNNSSQEQGQGM